MRPGTTQIVRPAKNVVGAIRLPGDKSISHRYAMLAGIAEGTTRLENFSTGADCASTLACMQALGAEVKRENGAVFVKGAAGVLHPRDAGGVTVLDCGNSGSTIRMLSGILAGNDVECELIGDESLSRRPMMRVITPLREMGAKIEASEGGRPPLHVRKSGKLKAIDHVSKVASAQVKSAVLFAGLHAEGETHYQEPFRTRDHSELALRAFGAEVTRTRDRVSITGGQRLKGIEATVPGDISSAAFFFCAAAIFPESNLVIEGLGMNPTRASLLDVLTSIGAKIGVISLEEKHGELVGTVRIGSNPGGLNGGVKIDGAVAGQIIDELPVLAAIAPYTRDGIEIRDARELRVKESDRIAAVVESLKRMGARVEEREDGLSVPGGQKLHGAEIDAHGDHRIAMAFAVAALRAEGETTIHGAEAAAISFPEFWTMLDSVTER